MLLAVFDRAKCQIGYVGGAYQQSYELRGTVNAMDQVHN